MVDGRDSAWRNRAPGPHAHRNTARQAMDGLWTEVCGQQKQSNDPGNNQHILNTPTIGRPDAQTAHPATFSTAPTHQPLGSANAETTPAANALTRRNMQREERVTVQGPVKKQQPDRMSHRGWGRGWPGPQTTPLPPGGVVVTKQQPDRNTLPRPPQAAHLFAVCFRTRLLHPQPDGVRGGGGGQHPPPPSSTSGGPPPQKASTYVHTEVPTGVLPQP